MKYPMENKFQISDKTAEELCYVNGINITLSDFGTVHHDKPIDVELPTFTPKPPTGDVLKKYGITEDEYQVIFYVMHEYMKSMKANFVMRGSFWQEGRADFESVEVGMDMNPDLYAALPPDKKEEYKKLFPVPEPPSLANVYRDSSGTFWWYKDHVCISIPMQWSSLAKKLYELNCIREIKKHGVGSAVSAGSYEEYTIGSLAFIPPTPTCAGMETSFVDYWFEYYGIQREHHLIKKGVKR